MNREKILEKSRRENILGDERDMHIKNSANEFGFALMFLVFIILIIISYITDYDITSAVIVFWGFMFGKSSFMCLKKYREFTSREKISYTLMSLGSMILLITSLIDLIKS